MLKKYLLFLLLHKIFVFSINITEILVPKTVAIGQRGILNCNWTQDDGKLYRLNWHAGGENFYKWTPGDDTPMVVYPIKGISIDTQKSFGGYVEFITTSTKAATAYRCEVTAEQPTFNTDSRSRTMDVVDSPDAHPNITLQYLPSKMNENITVRCSSVKAYPYPDLNFYLNNDVIDKSHISKAAFEDEETGLISIEANYTFVLKPYMFGNRKLKIKCTAEIYDVYWEKDEIEIPDHLLNWKNNVASSDDYAEHYDYQISIVSRNQSNFITNLLTIMVHIMFQTYLFVH